MKRMILLVLAGVLAGFLSLTGCKDDCKTCNATVERQPCSSCGAERGPVMREQPRPIESRTETERPSTPAQPAR
jgi:hypothetical protein